MSKRYGRKGFILIMSVILLLSITVIAASFIALVTTRTRAASSGLDSAKAFWLAEAGIQQAAYRLKTDAAYRDTPTNITGSLASGTYAVTVSKRTGETVYDVSSAGTAGITRNIAQTLTVTVGWGKQFTDYGAFAGAGSISMKNSAKITGDAYTAGSVTTSNTSSVTGKVYANSGSGNYTRVPLPSPPLASPVLDTTYYVTEINTAKTYASGNKTYNTLALAGGTVYVNGKVTAKNITGPGTVVSNGNFTLNGGSVGTNITIISNGTLSISSNSSVGSGAVLYAKTAVSSIASNVNIDSAAIITPGTVSISSNITFSGVILSGGNVTIGSNTVINGAVASGGTISMTGSGQIVQNKNKLPPQMPNGVETVTQVVLSGWSG